MNKILELIYTNYKEKPIKENPLETPKLQKAFHSFFDAYFGHLSSDKYDKAYDRLFDIISAYQENAFATGFYAGIKLMK